MSSETFTYKGISAGKYVEGDIDAINQEEASFKLKEQKVIITNLVKTKKKAATKDRKKVFQGMHFRPLIHACKSAKQRFSPKEL